MSKGEDEEGEMTGGSTKADLEAGRGDRAAAAGAAGNISASPSFSPPSDSTRAASTSAMARCNGLNLRHPLLARVLDASIRRSDDRCEHEQPNEEGVMLS